MRSLGFLLLAASLAMVVGCSSGGGDTEAIRPSTAAGGTTGEPPRPSTATTGGEGVQPFTGDAKMSGEGMDSAPRPR